MRRFLSFLLMLGTLAPFRMNAQAPQSPTGGLLVKIHVFSGRRNPEFRITDPAEIAKVLAILKAHGPDSNQAGAPEVMGHQLGYRGIEVIPEGTVGLEGISAFSVNNQRFQIHRKVGGSLQSTSHSDAGAELESFLLERGLAQGHVETKVVQRIHERH